MTEFEITSLETYRVRYKIQAENVDAAIRKWETMSIKDAVASSLDDTVGRRVNGKEF